MSDTPQVKPGSAAAQAVAQRLQHPRARLAIGVLVAVLVGLILWLTVGSSGGGGGSSAQAPVKPIQISASGLETLGKALPTPIYWAGPMSGKTYELSRSANGNVSIRYLPAGVEIGAKDPYLAIGTYPLANAYAVTKQAAQQDGAVSVPTGAGAVAFYKRSRPTNVYLARAGADFQVEVFDPTPGRARALVQSGRVAPVPGRASFIGGPHTVSEAGLETFASSAGHVVYWFGAKAGSTYELTATGDGRITIRYLPPGAKAGDPKPYLAVAMYPFPKAFSSLSALIAKNGATPLDLPGGGVGLVDAKSPKNIHLAFPGLDYQIEVFDPAGRAEQLVTSGQLVVVPQR